MNYQAEMKSARDEPVIISFQDIEQFDYIWVPTKFLQKHNFTKCPLRVCLVPEGIENFF